jgi:hypothetical protein
MSYKISGNTSDNVKVFVLDENNDFSIESINEYSTGTYTIITTNGAKSVIAETDDGEVLAYGNVTPLSHDASGDMGVIAGGRNYTDEGVTTNSISSIVISILSTALNFGDLTTARYHLRGVSNGSSDRGVFIGGVEGAGFNIMDYITISSPGDASDFGDAATTINSFGATDNGTGNRGVFKSGGADAYIHYITISSAGNSNTFGDRLNHCAGDAGLSNGTNNRGCFSGGNDGGSTFYNNIEYITISSLGNAQDFGDLTDSRAYLTGLDNGTNNRGVFASGHNGSVYRNTMDYITISSIGNATDFGDLLEYHHVAAGTSNKTNNRGLIIAGTSSNFDPTPHNIIEYITISSAGNATDFGDLMEVLYSSDATSNA